MTTNEGTGFSCICRVCFSVFIFSFVCTHMQNLHIQNRSEVTGRQRFLLVFHA